MTWRHSAQRLLQSYRDVLDGVGYAP